MRLGLRITVWTAGILLVGAMLFPMSLLLGVELTGLLFFGWFGFFKRVIPEIDWNGSVIGMSVLCLGLMFGIGHGLARWFWTDWTMKHPDTALKPWSWRATICTILLGLAPFFSGMAVIGAVHQTLWIAQSKEPWLVNRSRIQLERVALRILAGALDQAKLGSEVEPSDFREYLPSPQRDMFRVECRVILFYRSGSRVIESWMVIPLNPRQRELGVFASDAGDFAPMTDEEVAARLARHSGRIELHYLR